MKAIFHGMILFSYKLSIYIANVKMLAVIISNDGGLAAVRNLCLSPFADTGRKVVDLAPIFSYHSQAFQ